MKASVQINQGIESLFGTRDENIRLIESGLNVCASLLDNSIEIQGDDASVQHAERILEDYASLVREGHVFTNGDLNSYLRVVTEDPHVSLRSLVSSGRQRNFGKKVLAPKTVNQRRYLEAIERNDLVIGVGFAQGPIMQKVASDYPNAKFAIVDGVIFEDDGKTPMKNVAPSERCTPNTVPSRSDHVRIEGVSAATASAPVLPAFEASHC